MDQQNKKDLSRLAVLAAFFMNGAMMASWVSRIPDVQSKLAIGEGGLGLILMGYSIGVLTGLSLAGGLIARFGSQRVVPAGALLLCLWLPVLSLAPHPILLWLTLLLFGSAMSTMDMAMNEQAVLVERRIGRPIMSSFHASYSVGGLFGALLGAVMASNPGFRPLSHFLLVSILFVVLIQWIRRQLLIPAVADRAKEKTTLFRLPKKALLGLGMICFLASIAQGSISDWGAVYLKDTLQTSAGYAALAFAAFSLLMMVGRLFGDRLTKRFSPVVIVRVGGLLTALGFLLVAFVQLPIVTLIGFALVGLGVSNIVPLSFSVAGNMPGFSPAAAIAGVSSIGYAGFLLEPPLIGFLAEGLTLRWVYLIMALLSAALIFLARALAQKPELTELEPQTAEG